MRKEFYNAKKNDESRVIINMNVNDDADFLSVYSHSSTPCISAQVAEFIENEAEAAAIKDEFALIIHATTIDENEKIIYEKAIHSYYSDKLISTRRESTRNNRIALVLAILGVLVLCAAVFVSYNFNAHVWSEVIDIVAWVLIWEATDIIIFKNSGLRIKKHRYTALSSMTVEYTGL